MKGAPSQHFEPFFAHKPGLGGLHGACLWGWACRGVRVGWSSSLDEIRRCFRPAVALVLLADRRLFRSPSIRTPVSTSFVADGELEIGLNRP